MILEKRFSKYLPRIGITIFELKKSEATLEDAFIKLIDKQKTTKEKSKQEMKQDKKKEEVAKKENKKQKGGNQ